MDSPAYVSTHGNPCESNWPEVEVLLHPPEQPHTLQDQCETHHKKVGYIVQLGTTAEEWEDM